MVRLGITNVTTLELCKTNLAMLVNQYASWFSFCPAWQNISTPSSYLWIAAVSLLAWNSSGLDGQALYMQKLVTK